MVGSYRCEVAKELLEERFYETKGSPSGSTTDDITDIHVYVTL